MTRRVQLVCLLAFAAACGPLKDDEGRTPGASGTLVPTATPAGRPLGPPTTATVGAEGGTITAAGGALTVTVPPGAVLSATEFSVTPISVTARGGVSGAFRLEPEGTTFAAPITLTFKAPKSFPAGTSIAGLGVEYQDARGFWRRVEPVTRDAGANTVSVTTTHFSDWSLTWQQSDAVAEGPIQLRQTVDIPFLATGRAALYLREDSAAHTAYVLTGTLTIPDAIQTPEGTCVPDEATKTIFNTAEVTKSEPRVFQWGIGTTWSLTCTSSAGQVTTRKLPALFDTMYINLPRCGGYYEAGQIVEATHIQGEYTKNCGLEGVVNAKWDFRTCVPDQPCQVQDSVCRAGVTTCSGGIASCVDTGPAPNGMVCGLADTFVCSEAQCVDLNDQSVGFTLLSNGAPLSSITPLATSEGGQTATFDIVLNAAPTIAVTVGLTTSSPEGTVSPTSVTFLPTDWNVPQSVTVTGQNDAIADGDQDYFVVTANAESVDPRYSGKDVPDVALTNSDDDVAAFIVTPESGLVTNEAAGSAPATFSISLNSEPTADVTVALSSSDATEGTVDPATVTFTSTNWSVGQAVTVTGVDDSGADGPVAYSILTAPAVSADPGYHGRDAVDVAVTNSDNDVAGITVAPTAGLGTTEAGGTATFTVVLNSQPTDTVTIPLQSTNLAEGVPDVASVTFTPADWNIPKTVTVTGVDDSVDDGDVFFFVMTGAAIAPLDTTGYGGLNPIDAMDVELSNADDDTAGIAVSAIGPLTTTEATSPAATFSVVLTSLPAFPVTIPVSSSDPSEGSITPAFLTFTAADWNVPQTVSVAGVEDLTADGPQAYFVVLGAAQSDDVKYVGMDAQDLAATNLDNDVAGISVTPTTGLTTTEAGGTATFTIALGSQPASDVTISLMSSAPDEGTVAPGSVTFTTASWGPQTITVAGVNDDAADGPQSYTIQTTLSTADPGYASIDPADVSVTNTDNDVAGIVVTPTAGLQTTEAGGTASFMVVLGTQPGTSVTLSLASSAPDEGTVPPSIRFDAANWNVPQMVTVTGVDDAEVDGPQAYTIGTSVAAGSDGAYLGVDPADVSVTNVDNDVAGIVVTPTSGLQTTEAGGTASFTVVLGTQPATDVVVSLASSAPDEGTVPASIRFDAANWNVPQTVTVTGFDDALIDGPQAYTVVTAVAAGSDGAYLGVDPADVSVTNVDNDVAGILVTPTAGLQTTEAGGTATFTVVLTSQPATDVTVSLASSAPDEGTVPASITFDATNWSVPQTVTVTGVDDALVDGPQAYTIVTAVAVVSDANYLLVDPADVSVSNADNDVAGIAVTPTVLQTAEAGGTATFTVTLATQPATNVTVSLTSTTVEGTPTDEGTFPASITFEPGNWNLPQTVTVTGVDDALVDGPQTYTIVTTIAVDSDPAYLAVDPADVVVTNADDDVEPAEPPITALRTGESGAS